jgi:hypothetical protein
MFWTCAWLVSKSTVDWLFRRTRSELMVDPGTSWANIIQDGNVGVGVELRADDNAFFVTGVGGIIYSGHCMDLRGLLSGQTLEV